MAKVGLNQKMEISAFAKTSKPYPNPLDGRVTLSWIKRNQSGRCTKSTLTELNYIVT